MTDQLSNNSQLLNAKQILDRAGIAEKMIVADLGCGTNGHFCFPAARLVGEKGLVYAVDVRKTALENIKSRSKLEGINCLKIVWSDLEIYGSTNIRSDFVDLSLLINILFQSQKPFNILKEAFRITKTGGKFVIIDWKKTHTPFGPSLDLRIDKNDIQAMFFRLGAEQIDNFDAGKYHFGMIFEKQNNNLP